MAHTSNRVPGPSAGFEAGRDVGSNSAVAASYPGRRLSVDKLPTRAEPQQRDVTGKIVRCRAENLPRG
jgi:hypothetical protein